MVHPTMSQEMRVCSDLLRVMLDLQQTFDLPVEVAYCVQSTEGLVPVSLSYDGDDEQLLDWFTQTAETIYTIHQNIPIENG